MFTHVFKYRLKCLLRDKVVLFWTILFPIVLSTLFFTAFSNLNNAVSFTSAKVAVVDNEAYRNNKPFQEALVSVSEKRDEQEPLLSVELVSSDEAETLLEQGKVHGIILLDPDIKLVVKQSGMHQSIIKSFLDQYRQISASYGTVILRNFDIPANGDTLTRFPADDYLTELPLGKNKTDNTVTYYYALLAMASLYGAFWGLRVIGEVQADQSANGARINLAPVHKMKTLVAGILAAWIIQFVELSLLLLYMILVLKVPFGNQAGYILLTCLVGALAGLTLGTLVSGLVKRNLGLKIGVLIGLSMLMSGLAGLYFAPFKYIVIKAVPMLAYINPANLITDALYALYYYDTYHRFALNIALLLAFSAVFLLLTYLTVRRDRYASIPSIQEDN